MRDGRGGVGHAAVSVSQQDLLTGLKDSILKGDHKSETLDIQ